MDQIRHRFGLGKVEAPIEEGAFGEFSWLRQPRAAFEHALALIERGVGDFERAFWKVS